MAERPARISVIRERVTPELEAALDIAMAKTPADRYQTAAAFRTDLEPGARPVTLEREAMRASGGKRGILTWVRRLLGAPKTARTPPHTSL